MTLQEATREAGRHGGRSPTWSAILDRWVDIIPIAGREGIHAAHVEARVSHKLVMHYTPVARPRHRWVKGSRVFEIVSVINVGERNKTTECLCEEVVS